MPCVYQDDKCIGPIFFYENSDTAFVKLPAKDSVETFVLFHNDSQYVGQFIHGSDSTTFTIESDTNLHDSLISKIRKYQDILIEPNYHFAQKKLIDYISASFASSRIVFNKALTVLLHISVSGIVEKVEFPGDKTYLSSTEESELNWIYSSMPRWQPMFYRNTTLPFKITVTRNSTLSIMSSRP